MVLFLFPCGNPSSLCWRHHSINAAGGDAKRVLCSPQCAITRGLRAQGIEMSHNSGVLSLPTVRYLLTKANRDMYLIQFYPFEDQLQRCHAVEHNNHCIGNKQYAQVRTHARIHQRLLKTWVLMGTTQSRHLHRSRIITLMQSSIIVSYAVSHNYQSVQFLVYKYIAGCLANAVRKAERHIHHPPTQPTVMY